MSKQFFIAIITLLSISLNAASASAITLIRDEEVEAVMLEIVRPIFKVAMLDPKNVEINVIDQEEPNAFVIGGNAIFVSTGMIAFSNNPDAIAGVMAHEVGHIVGGHIIQSHEAMRSMNSKMLLSLLAGAAIGLAAKSSDAGIGTVAGLQSQAIGSFMGFNRSQESAADSASVKYMKALGLTNGGVLEFLQSIDTVDRTFYGEISEYQRTHPVTRSRIEFIKSQSIDSSKSYITQEIRDAFKMASAKIEGFTSRPDDVMRKYSQDTSDNARYAKAIALFRSNQKSQALDELEHLIATHPRSANFYELKGQILFESGNVVQSIPQYAKSYELNKRSDIIKIEYANALIYSKTEVQKAIMLLKQVVSKDRNDPMAWGLLAKAYDINRDVFNKHIALAYQSYLSGDDVTARKHLNTIKADKLASKSKDLKDLEQIMKSNPIKHDEQE